MANIVTTLAGRGPFTAYASAARIAEPDTQEFEAFGVDYSALILVADVTVRTGASALTVRISGVDRTSGQVYTITEAGIASVGTIVLKVGPALTPGTGIVNDYLPPIFRIRVLHGNGDSITYSVGAQLCP